MLKCCGVDRFFVLAQQARELMQCFDGQRYALTTADAKRDKAARQTIAAPIPPPASVLNAEALGHVLYTRYVYFFQAAGVVLLVAMIGAIVLTLRHKPYVKRQRSAEQIARTKASAIEIVKVRPGQGL